MCPINSRSTGSSSGAEAPASRSKAPRLQILLSCALAALAACAHPPTRPDLRRLYGSANLVVEQPPLILIPGIMGSQLRDRTTHRAVWPGSLGDLAFSKYPALALNIDPATLEGGPGNLEAFALTDKKAGQHFYDTIIDTLVRYGDYVLTAPGTPVRDPYQRHLYLFPYDWRLDNVVSAQKLSALIDQLRRDYGRPDLKVDIVAHSMGGIISRYFLRFGTEDVLDRDNPVPTMAGASKINRVILLGTPSLGSASSIENLVDGARILLQRIQPETVATLPSALQLLPNVDRKPLIGTDGRPLRTVPQDADSPERDLFEVSTWRDLKWSVFDPRVVARVGPERAALLQRYFARNLRRAGRLQRALQYPQQPDSDVKLIVFGADCMLTPVRVLVEEDQGRMMPRYRPEQIKHPRPGLSYDTLLREPGDGLVGKASLLGRQSFDPTLSGGGLPLAYSFFLCSEHSKLPGNISFQDNLLNALLSH